MIISGYAVGFGNQLFGNEIDHETKNWFQVSGVSVLTQ